jgi:hypothetical protein
MKGVKALVGIVCAVISATIGAYVKDQWLDARTVPELRNHTLKEARSMLAPLDLDTQIEFIAGGTRNLVVDQAPDPLTKVPIKTRIVLTVQQGPAETVRPAPKASAPTEQPFDLPVGARIAVHLPTELSLEALNSMDETTGQLAEPVVLGDTIVAMKGARVFVDVFSSKKGFAPTLRLSIREIQQVDGRPLYPHTGRLERTLDVGSLNLGQRFVPWIVGAFIVGILLWMLVASVGWLTPEVLIFCLIIGVGLGAASAASRFAEARDALGIHSTETLKFEILEPTHGALLLKP